MQHNNQDNQIGVYILEDKCSDFIKELAAYNGLDNLGEEVFADIDNKAEDKGITIKDFWFLGV